MKIKHGQLGAVCLAVVGFAVLCLEVGVVGALGVMMVAGGFFLYDQLGYREVRKDVRAIKAKDPRSRRNV